MNERERERERDAERVQSREIRGTVLRTTDFKHMILKLVNKLELLEDRITIHIWIDLYVHP